MHNIKKKLKGESLIIYYEANNLTDVGVNKTLCNITIKFYQEGK